MFRRGNLGSGAGAGAAGGCAEALKYWLAGGVAGWFA